jgi:hypothetical protein
MGPNPIASLVSCDPVHTPRRIAGTLKRSFMLILIAVLYVGPINKFHSTQDFMRKHRTSLYSVCQKYHAHHCELRKEPIESIDELGFATESGTVKWSVYGTKD